MTESQALATECAQILPWRTFEMKENDSILDRILGSVKVPRMAQIALHKDRSICPDERTLSTIMLTPKDFGFEGDVTPRILFSPRTLAAWNEMYEHRFNPRVRLRFLTQIEWLSVRDQYNDQSRGERLTIATEKSAEGDVFTIGRDSAGDAWIHFERFGSGDMIRMNERVLFGLEEVSEDSPPQVKESSEFTETTVIFDVDGHVRALAQIEAQVIRLAIFQYNGRMTEVARRLGIGRSTLYRKLTEHNLTQETSG